jgi:hypothetical protein
MCSMTVLGQGVDLVSPRRKRGQCPEKAFERRDRARGRWWWRVSVSCLGRQEHKVAAEKVGGKCVRRWP